MLFKILSILIGAQVIFTETYAQDTSLNYLKPHQSTTYNTVTVEGKAIRYKAVAGTILLNNAGGRPTASIFYTAYLKEGEKDVSQRPLTFIYNGGPGSSTIWLHMGAFGPRRVFLEQKEHTIAPYKTVNNDYSLLDASDLVFIDAPATGFSKILTKEMGGAGKQEDFFSADGDANAFADFIGQFLADYHRWDSPKYLFGESYGTFRSALLANVLQGKGVNLNGVILLSQILDIAHSTDNPTANPGNDTRFQLVLPTYAAVAWYHHVLPHQPGNLEPFLKEVEQFAMNDYALALNKGAMLDDATFNRVALKMHEYTGLSVNYIKKANLRIGDMQFAHELLNDSARITGRLDARFVGDDINPLGESSSYDPMDAYIMAPFIGTFNNYVRNELKFGEGQTFYPGVASVYEHWDFRYKVPGAGDPMANIYPNVMQALAQAMIFNPTMKVMLNGGYYDLGTPYYQGIYEMQHLPMPASLQKNIEYKYYHSGHMVYLQQESLVALHDNVAKFINETHKL